MGIIGLEEDIWSQWLKGVRPQVTVKIGKPFSISSSLPKDRSERQNKLSDIGDDIMHKIATLLPKKYRGEYVNDN